MVKLPCRNINTSGKYGEGKTLAFYKGKNMTDREKIEILQQSLSASEKENAELRAQLQEKENIIQALKKMSEQNEKKIESIMREHQDAIKRANGIAANYIAAIRDVKILREEYETEMAEQLRRIKKQK